MKRRNFLAVIPFIAAVCCKPKSKGTFEPYVPEEPETTVVVGKRLIAEKVGYYPIEGRAFSLRIAMYRGRYYVSEVSDYDRRMGRCDNIYILPDYYTKASMNNIIKYGYKQNPGKWNT